VIRVSIFHKIAIPVITIFVFGIVFGLFQVIRMERAFLSSQVQRSGEIIAKNVASITENAFWTLNWANVELFLQELVRESADDILAVQVIRPNGEIFLADDRSKYGDTVDPQVLTGQNASPGDSYFDEDQVRGVLVVRPIAVGQENWHALVALSLREVDATLAAWIQGVLAWGLLLIVIVAGLLLSVSRAIARPIIALTRSAEHIAQGDLDQVTPVTTRDEVGLLGTQFNRMVAHLKEAQARLNASEKRNRALLESASAAMIGIALVEVEGPRKAVFRYVNQAVCQLSGYDEDDLLGMSVNILIHPEDLGRIWRAFRRNRQYDSHASPAVIRGMRKDGLVVPVEVATSITDYDGRAVLSVFIRDISEKVQAEEQLRRHQEQLEQTVLERTRDLRDSLEKLKTTQSQLLHAEKLASIGQLAAGIAHEINTPAQFIGDNTQFLRQAITDLARVFSAYRELPGAFGKERLNAEMVARVERIQKEIDVDFLLQETPLAIDQILDGVERISKIVSSMREFAHPGGKEKTPVDLNRALENTMTVARNEWKYSATFEMDLDPDLPDVYCLPNEINQVFLNVLVNASQAIRDKVQDNDAGLGLIRISTRTEGDKVEIRISDTGGGIPKDIQARVFDPFFTTKDVGKGTGQGLAIAHGVVVEKHQGEITFESREGEGTTFIIRLPVGE
jgi:two-component system, NtrC family, sensor kinase